MKLDRAGLDYLIEVARGIGFRVASTKTEEDYMYGPEITIKLVQMREPKPPVEEVPIFEDVRAGVTEDQATEIASKAKDKLRTLDE